MEIDAKIIVICLLVAIIILLLFLWFRNSAGLRESVQRLEGINSRIEKGNQELSEQNNKLGITIADFEQREEEREKRTSQAVSELQEDSRKIESGIDGIGKRVELLEKTVFRLLDLLSY